MPVPAKPRLFLSACVAAVFAAACGGGGGGGGGEVPVVCTPPGLEINGRCEIPVDCAGGKIRDGETNACECPPTLPFDRDGACEAEAACGAGFVPNPDENRCECPPPRREFSGRCEIPVDCAGGKIRDDNANTCQCPPNLSFDRGGVCEPVAACAPPLIRNPAANRCECESPRVQVGGECQAPSAAGCVAAGMVFRPDESRCAARCRPGFQDAGGECADPCLDRPGRCELDRTHGAAAVRLPAVHAMTLADGTPVLGKGVTVGIIDVGPLHWLPDPDSAAPSPSPTTHSELPQMPVFGYDPGDFSPSSPVPFHRGDPNESAHPVAVAGIIAARKDDRGLVGVAPEAEFVYGNVNGFLRAPTLASLLIDSGASVINNSWTTDFYIAARDFRSYDEFGNFDPAQTRANLRSYLASEGFGDENFFSQAGRFSDPADRPIFVWTAGNSQGRRVTAAVDLSRFGGPSLEEGRIIEASSPGILSGLPEFFPELALNNIAVAAVDGVRPPAVTVVDGEELRQPKIAGFSSRCGGASFCISAPGVANYVYSRQEVRDEAVRLGCATPDDVQRCPGAIFKIFNDIIAGRYHTGEGSGFVLAPESARYDSRESYLPPGAGFDIASGTSFAAPLVSGSLALMRQYFMRATGCAGADCGLGGHELTRRILATADRRGIYADASVYGSGLLDLQNALTPQGETRLMTGRNLRDGASHAPGSSALVPPGALGDSVRKNLLSAPLAMFDSMNAPFPVSAAEMLAEPTPAGMGARLRTLMDSQSANQNAAAMDFENGFRGWLGTDSAGDLFFNLNKTEPPLSHADAFANPYAALAGAGLHAGMGRGGFGLAAFGDSVLEADAARAGGIHGLAAEVSFSGLEDSEGSASGFGLQAGLVRESDSLLAGRGLGGFGGIRARTVFAGFRGFGNLRDGWRFRAVAYWGRTDSDSDSSAGNSWWSGSENLWSGAYAAGLERTGIFRADDILGLWLGQPLRAEGGEISFRRPTGRTKHGDLTYREERWSARPSGRELALSGMYRRGGGGGMAGGVLRLSAGLVRDAGHRRGAGLLGRFLLAAEREF